LAVRRRKRNRKLLRALSWLARSKETTESVFASLASLGSLEGGLRKRKKPHPRLSSSSFLRSQKKHNSSGTYFCVDKSVTAVVIKGLAEHKDELGAPLCPCRHYDDKAAEAAQVTSWFFLFFSFFFVKNRKTKKLTFFSFQKNALSTPPRASGTVPASPCASARSAIACCFLPRTTTSGARTRRSRSRRSSPRPRV